MKTNPRATAAKDTTLENGTANIGSDGCARFAVTSVTLRNHTAPSEARPIKGAFSLRLLTAAAPNSIASLECTRIYFWQNISGNNNLNESRSTNDRMKESVKTSANTSAFIRS